MTYLDHNATTPLRPAVAEAMARAALEYPGNPSSVHAWGRRARDAVERARGEVAQMLGGTPEEIVFTSGGTEGNNLAVRGLGAGAAGRGRRHLITSPLEHPAVLEAVAAAAEGQGSATAEVSFLPVSAQGEIALDDLERALRDDTGLVTLALANHELGNLYPIQRFAAAVRTRGALMHTDAVQAAGKFPFNVTQLGVDAATISAHKLGGPKGVGAVFVRRGLDLPPLARGGHQERDRRPGTENVAGIVGFGMACALAWATQGETVQRLETLRLQLLACLAAIPGTRILGCGAGEARTATTIATTMATKVPAAQGSTPHHEDLAHASRLPGTVMVTFPGAPGQLVAIGLDLEGICVSTGAACSSGSLEPSPVLRALGLRSEGAAEGVRISMGWTTTADDITRLSTILPDVVARVRAAAVAPVVADEPLRAVSRLLLQTAAPATSPRGEPS